MKENTAKKENEMNEDAYHRICCGYVSENIDILLNSERCRNRYYKSHKPLKYSYEETKNGFKEIQRNTIEASSTLVDAFALFKKHPEQTTSALSHLQKIASNVRILSLDASWLIAKAENGPVGDAEKLYTFVNTVRITLDLFNNFKSDLAVAALLKKEEEASSSS